MTYRNYFTHLECSATGERYEKDRPQNLSAAGKPLLARYDLQKAKAEIDRDEIWARTGGFWKWRELLPVEREEDVLRLGEIDTPLIDIPVSAKLAGAAGRVIVKDESRLPTASFKARGLALGVSMAKSFGLKRLAMPTAGNAGAAMSAYARRGGMEAYVFCPEDAPEVNVQETCLQGGKVFRVNGLIHHCGALVGAGKEAMGWFDLSTLKEPYRAEGKKTMGMELAAQLGWRLPQAIFYPTGGGTGLIGMWKAFDEMEELGWIGPKRPKMFAVQSTGCAPIVKAFNEGADHAEEWMDADTMAAGMRVPKAVADFLILRAVRESGGAALAVTDEHIERCWHRIGAEDGLLVGPEGAATYATMEMAIADGLIEADAEIVLYNCGSGLKYTMPDTSRTLDRNKDIDWNSL